MEISYQVPAKSCSDIEHRVFWARVIVDQKASGMGIKEFCSQYQLSFSAMHYWKYKKQKTKITHNYNYHKTKSLQSNNVVAGFIPLQMVAETPAGTHHKNESVYNSVVEIQIVFKNGHRLVLPLATPEANLLLIIKAVAELRC